MALTLQVRPEPHPSGERHGEKMAREGPTIQLESGFKFGKKETIFYERCLKLAEKLHDLTDSGVSIRFDEGRECEFRWQGKIIAKLALWGWTKKEIDLVNEVYCQTRVAPGMVHTGVVKWKDVLEKVVCAGLREVVEREIRDMANIHEKIVQEARKSNIEATTKDYLEGLSTHY